MKSVRNLLIVLVALLVAPVLPGIAGAHVEISPTEAPAGKSVKFTFEVPHGCDGASTTGLVLQVPGQVRDMTAIPVKGWKADSTPGQVTWTGGPLPDEQTKEFPFTAVLYGKKGETVSFKLIQKCEGGASTAWIQSMEGGVEPEHPAPAVTLASTASLPPATEPSGSTDSQSEDDQIAAADAAATGEPTATDATSEDSTESDGGGDSKTVILLVIAGLAIGTITGLILRNRRSRNS